MKRLLFVIILGLVIGSVTGYIANAYTVTGCRYSPGSIDPIAYRFFAVSDSSLINASKFGADAWNLTPSPGFFREESISLDPEINITDDLYPSSPFYAVIQFQCTNGYYNGNEVNFIWNNSFSVFLNSNKKRAVASHELGHAYGLDHVTTLCRIMRADVGDMTDCLISIPQTDDINGAIAVNS